MHCWLFTQHNKWARLYAKLCRCHSNGNWRYIGFPSDFDKAWILLLMFAKYFASWCLTNYKITSKFIFVQKIDALITVMFIEYKKYYIDKPKEPQKRVFRLNMHGKCKTPDVCIAFWNFVSKCSRKLLVVDNPEM